MSGMVEAKAGEIADESQREAGLAAWADARRIVVKIGSALLVDSNSGRIRST